MRQDTINLHAQSGQLMGPALVVPLPDRLLDELCFRKNLLLGPLPMAQGIKIDDGQLARQKS
jgi:hypothetical protein